MGYSMAWASRYALIPVNQHNSFLYLLSQSHFILNEIPSDLETNMKRFTSAGLELAVTELDIRMTLPATQADLQAQATQYAQVIKSCVAVSGCVGVVSASTLSVYCSSNGLMDCADYLGYHRSVFLGTGNVPWTRRCATIR